MHQTFSHRLLIRSARLWLCAVFLMLRAGDWLFFRFAFDPLNPAPVLRGAVFAGAICTTVLLGAMWWRCAWSRYVLCTIIVLLIAAVVFAALMVMGSPLPGAQRLLKLASGVIMFYSAALVPLASARSIHHLMRPVTSGGD